MILPLSPPELLKRPVPLQKPLVLEIDPISPGLPRKIVVSYVTGAGTNRFENEARFEALAFTNVNGINLPTRVRTEYSHEVFGAKHFTVDIELKTFDPQASIESFRPLLGGDYRIINRDAPVTNSLRGAPESVSTRATNEWPSFQTFAALWNRWEMP